MNTSFFFTPHGIAYAVLFLFAIISVVVFFSTRGSSASSPRPRRDGRRSDGRGDSRQPTYGGTPGRTPDGDIEIYVGNLSYDVTDEMLRSEFAKFGIVRGARVVTHKPTGKSKGFGFVAMPHPQEAELAISKLDGTEMLGRQIHCNVSRGGSVRG